MKNISLKNIPFKNFAIVGICAAGIFFLLAVILSINLFIKADKQAEDAYLLDRAVMETTSIAEVLKSSDGDLLRAGQILSSYRTAVLADQTLILYYDDELAPSSESSASYKAVITSQPLTLHNAYNIKISDLDNRSILYELDFKYVNGGESQ